MSNNHTKELEKVAEAQVQEIAKLRTAHEEELSVSATQILELSVKLSDLEGELRTAKAALAAEPVVPKSNGTVAPQSPGVTKEELQRLYEAHNLKVHDLEAEHKKTLKDIAAKLEAAETQAKNRNSKWNGRRWRSSISSQIMMTIWSRSLGMSDFS